MVAVNNDTVCKEVLKDLSSYGFKDKRKTPPQIEAPQKDLREINLRSVKIGKRRNVTESSLDKPMPTNQESREETSQAMELQNQEKEKSINTQVKEKTSSEKKSEKSMLMSAIKKCSAWGLAKTSYVTTPIFKTMEWTLEKTAMVIFGGISLIGQCFAGPASMRKFRKTEVKLTKDYTSVLFVGLPKFNEWARATNAINKTVRQCFGNAINSNELLKNLARRYNVKFNGDVSEIRKDKKLLNAISEKLSIELIENTSNYYKKNVFGKILGFTVKGKWNDAHLGIEDARIKYECQNEIQTILSGMLDKRICATPFQNQQQELCKAMEKIFNTKENFREGCKLVRNFMLTHGKWIGAVSIPIALLYIHPYLPAIKACIPFIKASLPYIIPPLTAYGIYMGCRNSSVIAKSIYNWAKGNSANNEAQYKYDELIKIIGEQAKENRMLVENQPKKDDYKTNGDNGKTIKANLIA